MAATWPEGEHGAPKIAVNVSTAQLRVERFARDMAATLDRHGLPPERLIVEITESVAMASDPETRTTLAALRQLGVGLALDDFGTGYSSLSHLARTNVDLLKLDRAFLAGIDGDAAQARLLEGVLHLASSLGVSVVAEGIERPGQRERVLERGGGLRARRAGDGGGDRGAPRSGGSEAPCRGAFRDLGHHRPRREAAAG